MKRNIELLVFTATAAAVAGSAGVAVAGDSLIVKNGKEARCLAIWADMQTAGFIQLVRQTSGHDTTRDYRVESAASQIELLTALGIPLVLAPQETLIPTISGGAVAGDVETVVMLNEYDELNGLGDQQLISWAELQKRTVNVTTMDATIAAAVGPAFATSEETIFADSDLLKANSKYAIIGYRVRQECAAVYIKGPDTANVRVGGPGNDLQGEITSQWFAMLSRAYDRPMIPVIDTGNKGNTFVGVHADENAGNINVSFILALLK